MANTVPVPLSYQQILGQQLNVVRARLGIRKFKPGGQLLTIFEAASQTDAQISADVFNALLVNNLDNAEGLVLDRIGNDENLPRRDKKPARGLASVFDNSFVKSFSTLYHGSPAPIVGSTTVFITKGSSFDTAPPTGQIYLGRNTSNYEGPLTYSAKVDSGYFWTLTVSPTTKFHNQGESVVLAQGGNRPIQVGQTVSTALDSITTPVVFTITQSNTLLDGETEIDNIPVTCTLDGTVGNVTANSVISFGNALPFPNAQVTNPTPISFGRNIEQDNDYRDRIRQIRANRQRGTAQAIKNAIVDISSPDESSSVLSSNVVQRKNKPTFLYIDDGSGYEEKYAGIGFESVIDSATGGETDLYTVESPIAQAVLEASVQAPYVIKNGSKLTVEVGGVASTHIFDTFDFSNSSFSAFDIVSSINSNPILLFQARLSQNSSAFSIFSKSETNDDLQVVSQADPTLDIAAITGLSSLPVYTTSLYKNDILLSKDGAFAQITSNPFRLWGSLSSPETIVINVENTGPLTITISDSDFQTLGFSTLSNATPDIWAKVLISKIPGVTATPEIDKIVLTSNKGKDSTASISISGGTLVNKKMFSPSSSTGVSNDYSIDRSVGIVSLNTQLSPNDTLSLGTNWAEAFVQIDFGDSSFPVTTASAYYLTVDDIDATIIPIGMFNSGAFSLITKETNPLYNSFTLTDAALTPVPVPTTKEGDQVLFTDSAFPAFWKGIYRNEDNAVVTITKDVDTATRIAHTVTALNVPFSSKILICGGLTSIQIGIGAPGSIKGRGVTGNCQIYDTFDGSWTQLPQMIIPRAYHTATLLPNGKVFIAGGFDKSGNILASTELFDPTTNTFTAGPGLPTTTVNATPLPRVHHSATALSNGMVLIAGGCNNVALGSVALKTSIQYNPGSNSYQTDGVLNVARYGHQAVLDVDIDQVIVFGGIGTVASPAAFISSVEGYVDGFGSWNNRTDMSRGRAFFGAAAVIGGANSRIVVAGCSMRPYSDNTQGAAGGEATFQTYNPTSNTWIAENNINTAFPSDTIKFSQNDLIKGPSFVLLFGPFTLVAHYDFTTDAWVNDGVSQGIGLYINQKEGVVGAKTLSVSNCAWFGGAIQNVVSSSFQGIANQDDLNVSLVTKNGAQPVFTSLALNNGRIVITNSKTPVDVVTVPGDVSTLYTANSLTDALNAAGENTIAKTYQTTKTRLSTLSPDGALGIIDQDPALPPFPITKTVISQRSQLASVNSRDALEIPSGFQLRTVSSKNLNQGASPQSVILPDYDGFLSGFNIPEPVAANGSLVGTRNIPFGSLAGIQRSSNIGFGDAKNAKADIGAFSSPGVTTNPDLLTQASLGSYIDLRSVLPVSVGNPVYVAEHFKFSVNDTLNVTVDQDTETKRFTIPMARKTATNGTYQSPISLKDAVNNNATISSAFGIDYDFNDFAIISRARTITNPADAGKRALWRYYRFGEEGNNAAVRYVYPTGPNQDVSVSTVVQQGLNDSSYYNGKPVVTAEINIGSGTLRKDRIISLNTRLGVSKDVGAANVWSVAIFTGFSVTAGSRSVLNGDTTLDFTVPFSLNPGLNVGDILWFNGSAPASSTLQSGQFAIKTISNVGGGIWRITLDTHVLNDGTIWGITANPGTISTDPNQFAKFDDEVLVGDLVTFVDPTNTLTTDTMLISSIDPGRQYIRCSSINFNSTPVTTVVYGNLDTLSKLQIFAPPSTTVANIVAAVNAIASSPVQGVVVGTGTGVIVNSDWADNSDASFRYPMKDAVNYVANTNKPANTTLPTTFDLKLPVSSDLTSNNDFSNEVFYLVPQLNESVVQWLNTPCVTGLWSVSNITTSSFGHKVKIQSKTPGSAGALLVEGGGANLTTAAVVGSAKESKFNVALHNALIITSSKSEADNFRGNSWVELNNTNLLTKTTDASPGWVGNSITSITGDGVVAFSSAPYQVNNLGNCLFTIEKIGSFVAVSFQKTLNTITPAFNSFGDYLYIKETNTPNVANKGIFKILRFSQTESSYTYWIENPVAIDTTDNSGDVSEISSDSPIPGDVLYINSNVFGLANRGGWQIVEVGTNYTANTLTISAVNNKPLAFTGAISTTVKDVSISENVPRKAIRKLLCVSPNKDNAALVDLLLDDSAGFEGWSAFAGTVVTDINKLAFPNTIKLGNDAYRHNIGLIKEVKRVIYGDSQDVDNYPGYVAEGASLLIRGPVVKRVKVVLQVKLQVNSSNSQDVVGVIKSAVASVVNASGVGSSIAISDIVSAVQNVDGVVSVSIISPVYNSVQDQIPVVGQEKALIVDFDNDITVLVAG